VQIIIGSDHAGYSLKEHLKHFFDDLSISYEDYGVYTSDPVDYPEIAVAVSEAVSKSKLLVGILICGTGIGMSIVANKIKGIRAALCMNEEMAALARVHNNANILVLAGRMIDFQTAEKTAQIFLQTSFESGTRHERRVNKIHDLTRR
jgi:ribose 5-phosphate isomerase B